MTKDIDKVIVTPWWHAPVAPVRQTLLLSRFSLRGEADEILYADRCFVLSWMPGYVFVNIHRSLQMTGCWCKDGASEFHSLAWCACHNLISFLNFLRFRFLMRFRLETEQDDWPCLQVQLFIKPQYSTDIVMYDFYNFLGHILSFRSFINTRCILFISSCVFTVMAFYRKHFPMNVKLTSAVKTFNQLKREKHARMYQHAYLFAVDVFSFNNLIRYMNVRLFLLLLGNFQHLVLDQPHLKSQLRPRCYCLAIEHLTGLVISQSHSVSATRKKKKQMFFFSSLGARWGRKNIALQLTSNQIALGFHSLCPHSICTSHHGPTRISHPAWVILASSPQQIVPLAQHAACACANAHFVIRQAWSRGHGTAANDFICSKCGFNDILHALMLFFANPWDGLGRSVPVMLVPVWHFEQKTAIITGRDLFTRKPDL